MGWTEGAPDLAVLDEDARRTLDAIQPKDVSKGTVLFQPGDAVRGYVFVLEGRVGVHLVGPTGRDILLYEVIPGKSCIQSTLGLLGGEDYTGEAIAETPARIVLLPQASFLGLLDSTPGFRRLVFTAFAERLQAMMHLVETVAFQKVEVRLAAHILSHADETGCLATTQQDIASAIGSAREVVSRQLDTLARRGWLTHARGKVQITDGTALRALAEAPLL